MSFAFVFPGQGSQKIGMMQAYCANADATKIVRTTFEEASQTLQQDLWELADEGPELALSQTENTQPLMLTADIAVWRLWQALGGGAPDMVAGHSLGEYAALVAAKVIEFDDAVKLVRQRAEAMQAAVPQGVGAMAAILGLEADTIVTLCAEATSDGDAGVNEVVEAVNFNDPVQTVIAGHQNAVARAMELCQQAGAKRAIPLTVSAPFHSRLMRPAAVQLAAHLGEIELRAPDIPVIHNVDAALRSEPPAIHDALVRQADHPVRWVETVAHMDKAGIQHIVECGPGKVLKNLCKRCAHHINTLALSDHATMESHLDLE